MINMFLDDPICSAYDDLKSQKGRHGLTCLIGALGRYAGTLYWLHKINYLT